MAIRSRRLFLHLSIARVRFEISYYSYIERLPHLVGLNCEQDKPSTVNADVSFAIFQENGM